MTRKVDETAKRGSQKRIKNLWVKFLKNFRLKNGKKYSRDKEGKIALMQEAVKQWKAMTKSDKEAFKTKAAIAEAKEIINLIKVKNAIDRVQVADE